MSTSSERVVPGYFSNIRVVLIEPRVPGNIGAAARAMKTMGLSRLTLVNPVEFHTDPETGWMAHGAEDVIKSARVVPSLDEALVHTVYAVGAANRMRGASLRPAYPMRQAASEVIAVAQRHPAALLFGREDRGLLNDELERCHLVARIPAACVYPSLNLAQAVMVCAYELFQACQDPPPPLQLRLADIDDVERICRRIHDTLHALGFVSRSAPDAFLRSIRRVFRRSFRLEKRDVGTLHKICDHIDYYIEKHGGGEHRKKRP